MQRMSIVHSGQQIERFGSTRPFQPLTIEGFPWSLIQLNVTNQAFTVPTLKAFLSLGLEDRSLLTISFFH